MDLRMKEENEWCNGENDGNEDEETKTMAMLCHNLKN